MRKLLVVAALVASFILPHLAFAAFSATDVSGSTGLSNTGTQAYGATYVANAANTNIATWIGSRLIAPAFSLVGVIFFALMVYAGFLWMTAQGDPKQVTKAKDILVTSVIGVIIVVSAYVITTTILTAITTGSTTSTPTAN